MAVTNFSPLLGLALPTTGDLSGTWGTVVNDSITGLLDSAVAGTTTLSADADVTLSTTNGAANQARNAVILWTASGSVTRNITAPAQSKAYVVINATGGTQAIVLRGAGPTTGITVAVGEKCLAAWNGSDFVKVSSSVADGVTSVSGAGTVNGITLTGTVTSTGSLTLGGSLSGVNLASQVTGVLPEANGGTGESTYTNGQLLIGNASGGLTKSTLTAGTNVTITNGDGGITISATDTTGITAGKSIAFDLIFAI